MNALLSGAFWFLGLVLSGAVITLVFWAIYGLYWAIQQSGCLAVTRLRSSLDERLGELLDLLAGLLITLAESVLPARVIDLLLARGALEEPGLDPDQDSRWPIDGWLLNRRLKKHKLAEYSPDWPHFK